MKPIFVAVSIAAAFAGGWFSGREVLKYQMFAAVTNVVGDIATSINEVTKKSEARDQAQQKKQEERSSYLAKIAVSNARIGSNGMAVMTPVTMHFKNGTEKTLSSVMVEYSLKSADREVAWDDGKDVYFSFSGGLAPGEERDEECVTSGPVMNMLKKVMHEHPDAALTLSVQQASGPDKKPI